MSPESQARSRRRDARHNRDALLAAAKRVFDDRGPDAPLDEIAKAAGVANATLYRHFATRAELIVAVYAEEVAELDGLSTRLLDHADPVEALDEWLRVFVLHVATKRELALAVPEDDGAERGTLFAGWHRTVVAAADRLIARAQRAGGVRPELTATDLVTVAGGLALTGASGPRLDAMLRLVRDGYSPRPT